MSKLDIKEGAKSPQAINDLLGLKSLIEWENSKLLGFLDPMRPGSFGYETLTKDCGETYELRIQFVVQSSVGTILKTRKFGEVRPSGPDLLASF